MPSIQFLVKKEKIAFGAAKWIAVIILFKAVKGKSVLKSIGYNCFSFFLFDRASRPSPDVPECRVEYAHSAAQYIVLFALPFLSFNNK